MKQRAKGTKVHTHREQGTDPKKWLWEPKGSYRKKVKVEVGGCR